MDSFELFIEIQRVRTLHQDLLAAGRDSDVNRLDISHQVQRIQRNVHEHLSPGLLRFVDEASRVNPGKLIPLNHEEHWICTVPRHGELEQVITDLQNQIEEHRRHLAATKHENRRLERSLAKKSVKIDALDLAASKKRSKSIADAAETEHVQVKSHLLDVLQTYHFL